MVEHGLIPVEFAISCLFIHCLRPAQSQVLLVAEVEVVLEYLFPQKRYGFLILGLIDHLIEELVLEGDEFCVLNLINTIGLKDGDTLSFGCQ